MGSCNGAATVVALLAMWQMPAAGRQPTFRSATELVSVNVAVTDAKAQPVRGLSAEQFVIFEDGVRQDVKFFSPGELALDVVILIDTSGSMTGSMALVQQAAIRFARALRPTDHAAVMGISGGLRVLQQFTSDRAMVEAAITATQSAGRTALYASIYTALNELEKQRRATTEPRRQAIVMLSDGCDTSSTFTFDELLKVVRSRGVPIYAIVPRSPGVTTAVREHLGSDSTRLADFELRKIASETGARSFFPNTLSELAGVYDAIATELAHQYSLAYQSSNTLVDGQFRRIALKINVPGLQWRTRAGYIAERARAARATLGGDER